MPLTCSPLLLPAKQQNHHNTKHSKNHQAEYQLECIPAGKSEHLSSKLPLILSGACTFVGLGECPCMSGWEKAPQNPKQSSFLFLILIFPVTSFTNYYLLTSSCFLFLPPLPIAFPVVLRKMFLCNPPWFGNGVTMAFSYLPGDISILYVFEVCSRERYLDSIIHLFSCNIYLYASNPLLKKISSGMMARLSALKLRGTAKPRGGGFHYFPCPYSNSIE